MRDSIKTKTRKNKDSLEGISKKKDTKIFRFTFLDD